jgi:hypothetical protein
MLGIKLVWGNMKHPKWLANIAMHCDAWLIRISFFLGADLGTQARYENNEHTRIFFCQLEAP